MKTKFLQEGDLFKLKQGSRVYGMAYACDVYCNSKSKELVHTEIKIGKKVSELTFVVIKTARDGGGTGMGPHDIYPDGHHVWCEDLETGKNCFDFYQSGCFTCMIENIKPIGKAKRKWITE